VADAQRSEKPTPRRIEKARREGHFPVSKDLVSAVHFMAFVAIFVSFGESWLARAREATRRLLTFAFRTEFDSGSLLRLLREVIVPVLTPLLVAGAFLLMLSLLAQLVTTRGGFSAKKLAPDLKRLNPLTRLKGMPGQNVPMFLQAVVLLPLFAFAVYMEIGHNLQAFLSLPMLTVQTGSARVAGSLAALLWKCSALFLMFGLIDFLWQRFRYTKSLRMSKQEIREEFKEQEGDPMIKMRVRRIQRDLLRRSMMKQVPTATAVIVNPTHFAVAIKYSLDSPGAPVVVAKGKNYLALRIKKVALENEVPIVENPPLAQALYKSVDVGQEIPSHLYRAVAEILAYIYKLTGGRI
jgi:flagellar biosynthetic protein FlhB